MDKVILIKYGELTTKGDNRKEFIKILAKNINEKTKDLKVNIIKEHSRMYINYEQDDEVEVLRALANTFGIHKFNIAYKVETNIEIIKKTILELLNDFKFNSFKVITK